MIVTALIAVVIGVTFPAINSGIDSLRLRAATDGIVGSPGCGRMAFTHIARILPGVSFPSSVVRSIIEMASFRPATFAAFLMLRLSLIHI